MTHLRQETRFQIGETLQVFGTFFELGVEGDNTSVGFIKLAAVDLCDLCLAILQLLKCVE